MVTIDGKGLLSAIGAVVAAASFNVGCLSPNSVTCSDGRVCPVGTACDEVKHLCFTPAALAACAGAAEGDDCVVSQVLGTCHSGGCRLGDSVWSATAAIGAVGAVWAREPDDAYAVGPSWWATGNTPGAASPLGSTRNAAARPAIIIPPWLDGVSGVKVAGRVEEIFTPSPRSRPICRRDPPLSCPSWSISTAAASLPSTLKATFAGPFRRPND